MPSHVKRPASTYAINPIMKKLKAIQETYKASVSNSNSNSTSSPVSASSEKPSSTALTTTALTLINEAKDQKLVDFIEELEDPFLTPYQTFVVGNDPVITGLNTYKATSGPIAIVGLGGMRVLLLACELDAKNAFQVPKIFLIDNSYLVIDFWRGMIKIAETSLSAEIFFTALAVFLDSNKKLYISLEDNAFDTLKKLNNYHNQNVSVFFKNLFKQYGYSYVRSILIQTKLINQTWADEKVFTQLHKIITKMEIPSKNVYAFPSNVVSYMKGEYDTKAADQILQNIAQLNPRVAIHTNLDPNHGMPTKVFLLEDHIPDKVIANIFKPNPSQPHVATSTPSP